MAEWKIRRRQHQCSGCENTFEEGARHVSLLRIDEEENLLREDLCPRCWSDADSDAVLFWWATRFREGRRKGLQLDLDSLERLFMQLEGKQQEKVRELRYLLCLLLMRKRKLKLVRVDRGRGGERLVLRRPRRNEALEVHVFDFTPEKIEELRGRLEEVLEGVGDEDEDEDEEAEGGESGDLAPGIRDRAS